MSIFSKVLSPLTGKSTKFNPKDTIGTGSAVLSGGYLQTNEKSPKMQGSQKYTTYSNVIANTTIVAVGIRYFLNLVAKAQWKAEPADDSAAAVELAEFVESVLEGTETSWSRIIKRSAMYRFYGFSIQEWTAIKREDGRIGLKDIEVRAQSTIERWDLDPTGTLLGVMQRSPQTQAEIYLPRRKLCYLVDDALSDTPEGLGLLRHVVDSAGRLSRYEVLEGYGFEGDLRGVPLARAPLATLDELVKSNQLTKADKEQMLKPLNDFLTNHIKNPRLGMLLDSATYITTDDKGTPSSTPMWDLEVMSIDSTAQPDVAAAIERINREIARVLSIEGLLLGSDSKGSHALSKDKSNALYLIVDSTLTEVREGMEKDIIDPLWELNGFDPKLKPKLKTEAIQFRDVEQMSAALRDLATAGAPLMPGDPAINEVRQVMGLSDVPEELVDEAMQLNNKTKENQDDDLDDMEND